MVLACGRCVPRCITVPCWPLGIFAGRRSRKAASSARLTDRKRPDGRLLYKGGRAQRARASSASSSCFRREGGAESENRQHSLFSVFGTTSEHHQHHRCLCAGDLRREKPCYACLPCAPSAIQNEKQMMLMMLAVCFQC